MLQTTGESGATEARAARICALAAMAGITITRDRLTTPDRARHRAVSPGATFSAVAGGRRVGGLELSDADLLAGLAGSGYSPS